MCHSPPGLLGVAPSDDETVASGLVGTGLDAHEPSAPGRSRRIVADGRLTFTTAMGVVVRVHDGASDGRSFTEPSGSASLAFVDKVVILVSDVADRGTAGKEELADFTGSQSQRGILAFLAEDLGSRSGSTADLAALAGFEFDVVDNDTFGDVGKLHAVSDSDFASLAIGDFLSDLEALGADDVSLLALLVDDEGDAAVPVGVVLDGLDDAFALAGPAEVDETVHLLVAAADVTAGDVALGISSAGLLQGDEQSFFRSLLREIVGGESGEMSHTRSNRVILLDCHFILL